MKRSSFFSQVTFTRVAWSSLAVMGLFILMHLFVIGGDEFVITVSDALPIPLAILTAVLVFIMWRNFAPLNKGRRLWGWFVLGWSLWAIGEILYVVMGFLTNDVPYPSIADFAYILGSIFLIGGLVKRIEDTPRHLRRLQVIEIWLIAIILITTSLFLVIIPVLQADAGSGFLITLLDVFYPVSDLLLLLMAIRLLFDYDTQKTSRGWVLVIIGFILVTIADLMLSYLNSQGLYYPDNTVNLASSFGNAIPYVLAYLFWALGVYRLQIKQEVVIKSEEIVQPIPVENTHIVFFVDNDLNIDEVSANSSALGRATIPHKENFAALFKLSTEERDAILDALRLKGSFADRAIFISHARGGTLPAKLSGLSVRDPQKNFIGGLLVLRIHTPLNNLDNHLTEYQASIAKQVKNKSGSREEEAVCHFLLAYFTPIFNRIRELVYQYGGAQQGATFTEFINQQAIQSGWKIKVTDAALESSGVTNPAELFHELTTLVSTARAQLEQTTDRETVERELTLLTARFSDEVRNNLSYIKQTWGTLGKV